MNKNLRTFLFLFFALIYCPSILAQIKEQFIPKTKITVRSMGNLHSPGMRAPLDVDLNALYSNVTTYSGSIFSNGDAQSIDGNVMTSLVADSLEFIGNPPYSIGAITFSMSNGNSDVPITIRPKIRIYLPDGTDGAPGTIIAGYTFEPITLAANTVQLITGNITALAVNSKSIWAGLTYDNNSGSGGTTLTQMNLVGQAMFGPPERGSSDDDFFLSDAADPFITDNPAGSPGYSFGGDPVANFGWEFVSDVPLPVTLTSFEAVNRKDYNQLSWTTSQESNTDFFTIYRSSNGTTFSKTGQVAAAGNSTSEKHYTYNDEMPGDGANFYKLGITDKDGSSTYSKIVSVRNDNISMLKVYPNPVKSTLHLDYNASQANSVKIIINSPNGEKVFAGDFIVSPGNNQLKINVTSFPAGIYYLKIQNAGEQKVISFTKQ